MKIIFDTIFSKKYKYIPFIIIFAGFLFRLSFLVLPFEVTIDNLLIDDSYYSLKIAKNLALHQKESRFEGRVLRDGLPESRLSEIKK